MSFRFVLIGTGNIASTYLTAVSKIEGVEVVGAVSRSGRMPKGAGDKFELKSALAEIESEFDAVIIATPNGMHHQGVIAAAELGKHALTEKPLDITVDAMDKMIAACKEHNVKLGVTYQRRLSPDNIIMKKLLDAGALGRVFGADMIVECWRDQAYYDSAPYRGGLAIDGGGPFIQQAAHNVDIYAWFFGKPEKTVSMLGTFMHDIEGEDHGTALLRHANGMIGTIAASTSARPGFDPSLEIHAEKGSVIMKNDIITFWDIEGMENPSVSAGLHIHSGAGSAAVNDTSGHEGIIKDFIIAVRENRKPVVSGEEARVATEIVLDIYKSNIY
jgi:UDP-N-acetyl-2-amino-2-deoxyglucuronate dehydrogenase